MIKTEETPASRELERLASISIRVTFQPGHKNACIVKGTGLHVTGAPWAASSRASGGCLVGTHSGRVSDPPTRTTIEPAGTNGVRLAYSPGAKAAEAQLILIGVELCVGCRSKRNASLRAAQLFGGWGGMPERSWGGGWGSCATVDCLDTKSSALTHACQR